MNTFRLRNFDMTVNEMEFLRLDTGLYAETMARTLAIIHWKAKLDANDVEFVFGAAPKIRMRATAAELEASNHVMWKGSAMSSISDNGPFAFGFWTSINAKVFPKI